MKLLNVSIDLGLGNLDNGGIQMDQILLQTLISINIGIWILVAIHVITIISKIIRYVLFRMEIQMMDMINDININE